MSLAAVLFNPVTRNVAVRLTVASIVAMAAATALALPNPWWAAMAVWMVGQPPRGLLLERSLAQLIGSVLGAAAGVALILLWPEVPAASVLGLAVWIALCCGIGNLMRHQRAYGAALCGLTSAVIVCLTLGTHIDPVDFAVARVLDNMIGIGSAILAAVLLGPPAPGSTTASRARTVTSQALMLIAEALKEPKGRSLTREREFLLSLASLESSAEDAAAGSMTARRKLKELNALFAFLLDLVVVARAIRFREGSTLTPANSDMTVLREAFDRSAGALRAGGDLDAQAILAASRRLEMADPVLRPVLDELRSLLRRAAQGYERVMAATSQPATRWSFPHPDWAALRLAALRGAIAVCLTGVMWHSIGWDSLRYLVLGTAVFTVLFSAADEPVPVVRQVLIGALGASAAAFLWRIAVVPELPNGWLSLALAIPLIFCAALLQAGQGTAFIGLAFNMLFAVLARPVDTTPSSPINLAGIEVMLLFGIAISYAFFRWLLPMDTQRRRTHLKASIRTEIAAISLRAATPWAGRHLARLRYLVFSLAVRSRGQIHEVEDALAALSLGHVLFRLGEMKAAPDLPAGSGRIIQDILRLTASPISDPRRTGELMLHYAAHVSLPERVDVVPRTTEGSRLRWLLELAADDLVGHPSIFASRLASSGQASGKRNSD